MQLKQDRKELEQKIDALLEINSEEQHEFIPNSQSVTKTEKIVASDEDISDWAEQMLADLGHQLSDKWQLKRDETYRDFILYKNQTGPLSSIKKHFGKSEFDIIVHKIYKYLKKVLNQNNWYCKLKTETNYYGTAMTKVKLRVYHPDTKWYDKPEFVIPIAVSFIVTGIALAIILT